jgi:hypothetical protein
MARAVRRSPPPFHFPFPENTMQLSKRIAPALVLALVTGACAMATRTPLTDVPAGTYVLVEPQSNVFNAVTINPSAFALRAGNTTMTGQHWVDREGRINMVDDTGPCAGMPSLWTYTHANNRVTLTLVEDRCTARPTPMPARMVYERR